MWKTRQEMSFIDMTSAGYSMTHTNTHTYTPKAAFFVPDRNKWEINHAMFS